MSCGPARLRAAPTFDLQVLSGQKGRKESEAEQLHTIMVDMRKCSWVRMLIWLSPRGNKMRHSENILQEWFPARPLLTNPSHQLLKYCSFTGSTVWFWERGADQQQDQKPVRLYQENQNLNFHWVSRSTQTSFLCQTQHWGITHTCENPSRKMYVHPPAVFPAVFFKKTKSPKWNLVTGCTTCWCFNRRWSLFHS